MKIFKRLKERHDYVKKIKKVKGVIKNGMEQDNTRVGSNDRRG